MNSKGFMGLHFRGSGFRVQKSEPVNEYGTDIILGPAGQIENTSRPFPITKIVIGCDH